MTDTIAAAKERFLGELAENREWRESIEADRRQARLQLTRLVHLGRGLGVPVAHMAKAAGASRETVHVLLREAPEEGKQHAK